jgi:hypothetical protein
MVQLGLGDVPTVVLNPEEDAIPFSVRADRDRKIISNAADVILQEGAESIGELLKVNIYRQKVIPG